MFDPCDIVFAVLHVILTMLKWVFVLSLLSALLFGRACSDDKPKRATYVTPLIGGDVSAFPGGGR